MKLVFLCFSACIALLNEANGSKVLITKSVTPFSLLPFLDESVTCTAPGSYCSDDPEDCDSIFLCLPGEKNPMKSKCDGKQTCNKGKCSIASSPMCEYHNKEFQCRATGMFPEPSTCKGYNICCDSSSTPTTLTCDTGYGYNPFTTFCDVQLQNNECDSQNRDIPPCSTVGQNGGLITNPVLYYICLPYSATDESLYPFIYKCPNGEIYMGDFVCQ